MEDSNNKRIAKNTLMLYFRMLLTMVVSLFTVRIVLNTLGVVDYGINNVVGGIVVMFSFFSNTMASASQRFFAFELGRNDIPQLKKTFNMTVIIYAFIGVIILLLAETLGLWFLNNKMVIPTGRMDAANWIFQFSILSFLVTIMTIPYNAAIIARENMKVYAYVSIVEVVLKLGIVYILVWFPVDKLKLYALLMFATTCAVTLIYRTICRLKYEECRFHFYWDKKLFNLMFNFSSWKIIGSLSGLFCNQGINILINLFFGPAINAARAIAYQVNNAIVSFSSNFYTSVNPQITKSYAADNKGYMVSLAFQSSKYSFYLLLMLSMPIMLEVTFLLNIWLQNITEYMVIFTRLIIVFSLINSLENPLSAMVQASGNIKWYQILVGSVTLLCLPVTYFLFKLGFSPQTSIYVLIVVYSFAHLLRLWIIKDLFDISIRNYFNDVLSYVIEVSLVAIILPAIVIFCFKQDSLIRFLFVCVSCELSLLTTIYFIGLNKNEQIFIFNILKKYVFRKKLMNIYSCLTKE